jgi:hypothetical protein
MLRAPLSMFNMTLSKLLVAGFAGDDYLVVIRSDNYEQTIDDISKLS